MVTLWPREGPEEPLGFWPPTQDSTVSSIVSEQSPLPRHHGLERADPAMAEQSWPRSGFREALEQKAFKVKEGEVWVLGVPLGVWI